MSQDQLMIQNIKLDLSFYNGDDLYSDGDIEDEILEIVKKANDYDKYINESDRFEIFYHLSREREMIVQPMDISLSQNVLEVGAGCGAITGALARKAKNVDCIELSKKRSLINAYRNRQYNNIKIYVGNYEDIRVDKQYDVITLVGVLEYAGCYIKGENPYEDMLKNLKDKLCQHGKVYIAIENRLGMKYFSGCKEDHYGKEFVGIEGYRDSSLIRTFSYYELVELIKRAGFSEYTFFYPFPDYKFPHKIYSDEYLPQKGDLQEIGTNYTSSRRQFFDERKAFDSLFMREEFKIFSNSFLVELKK